MISITLCFKVNTKTILLMFALHFANVYPYFRGWREVRSGNLVLNSGDKWEVGLTKYVGSGFGGRSTIKHGGRWEVGLTKYVGSGFARSWTIKHGGRWKLAPKTVG